MIDLYSQNQQEIKINFYAISIGIVASLTGFVFRNAVEMLDEWIYGSEHSVFTWLEPLHPVLKFLIIILIPAIGGGIVGFGVMKIASEAKGHGIPNVMKAMHTNDGIIRPRVPVAKFILSIITIGTGNSAGSEGPIAQIGAGLGSVLGQKFKLTKSEINILIATGASSGIAAVFNAPLGGALFGIEVLLASITLRSVIPVIVGSATAIATNNIILNNYESVFEVPGYTVGNSIEYVFILLMGLIIAIVGIFWQKSLEFSERKFNAWKIALWIKTSVAGLIVGILLSLSTHDLRGSSYALIQNALLGHDYYNKPHEQIVSLIGMLILFLLVKILITSLSLGSGQSGGVFSPSLLMGALTGVAYGLILHILFPSLNINPGLYAVLGMASLFGGIARAPLTMVIITTEMAGEYQIFAALMLVIAVSYLLHNYLLKESIYTESLVRYGLSTHVRTVDDALNFIPVRDVMSSSVVCIYEDTPTSMLPDIFVSYHHSGYIVIDRENHLKGVVTLTDLRRSKIENREDLVIGDIMTTQVISLAPHKSVKDAIDLMYRNGIGRVAITIEKKDTKELIPVGLFTRSDIIKTLESLYKHHEDEHEKKMTEFKKKITQPFINVFPSSFPHLKGKVVKIEYDWVLAYQKITEDQIDI
ncbi:MAG: chloride channel protein [Candidatus Heimdallarchaeota archaeon]|nr:chloride channel protein [Candidatus Heimdallarchaeota archaeon]